MDAKINGYKIIAIVAVVYGLFSCTQNANSTSDPQVLAKLDAIEAKLDLLMADMGEVQTAVGSAPAGQRACTVEEVIAQNLAACDETLIPADVGVTTTYCIDQGRAGSIGASFKVEPEIELDLGAGWPNVIWGKLTGKATIPPVFALGPIVVPLPNEVSASGETSLGRGLSLCVDIPLKSLAAPEVEQVHALVRGINEPGGKYARRTGRVLNYAALRTPGVAPTFGQDAAFAKARFQDDENSFDIADAAIENLIAGDFNLASTSGLDIFRDQTFKDLASAMDLPQPALDTFADPERIFSAMQRIGQVQVAATCDSYGITPAIRARFPALDNQCDRFGIYPRIDHVLEFPGRIRSMFTESGLKTFICDNVSLSVIWSSCG